MGCVGSEISVAGFGFHIPHIVTLCSVLRYDAKMRAPFSSPTSGFGMVIEFRGDWGVRRVLVGCGGWGRVWGGAECVFIVVAACWGDGSGCWRCWRRSTCWIWLANAVIVVGGGRS